MYGCCCFAFPPSSVDFFLMRVFTGLGTFPAARPRPTAPRPDVGLILPGPAPRGEPRPPAWAAGPTPRDGRRAGHAWHLPPSSHHLADLPQKSGPVAMRVGSTVPVAPAGRRRLCGVGPRARRRERRWRAVAQRTVRPDRVVLLLPLLAQHPRLQQAGELLALQQLIPQPAVERLGVAILPRCPRLDVQRPDARPRQPGPQRLGNQLRPVVAAQMTGEPPVGPPPGPAPPRWPRPSGPGPPPTPGTHG